MVSGLLCKEQPQHLKSLECAFGVSGIMFGITAFDTNILFGAPGGPHRACRPRRIYTERGVLLTKRS